LTWKIGYSGQDYPREWPSEPLERVHMPVEDSVHYALDTATGVAEWKTMLPSGDGVLHLGPDKRQFTISLFHQLRCLNVLRAAMLLELDRVNEGPPEQDWQTPSTHHCMSYIRQTVLCRANLRLESVKAPYGLSVTNSDVTHTCRDWTVAYNAAEDNYLAYANNASSSD
jgi:hypothetical protein